MKRCWSLLWRLVIPLLALAGACIWLHQTHKWDGFFVSLSTNLIAIVITVLYVDYAITMQKEAEWDGVKQILRNRLEVFSNSAISSIKTALGYGSEILGIKSEWNVDIKEIERHVIRFVRETIKPSVQDRFQNFTVQSWQAMSGALNEADQSLALLVSAFHNHMVPANQECILRIQHNIMQWSRRYTQFGHILCRPDEELRSLPGYAFELKRKLTEIAAEEIRAILNDLCKILEAILDDKI